MRPSLLALTLLILFCFLPHMQAQQTPLPEAWKLPPWWVSFTLGEGQLKISSVQQQGDRVPRFAMGFEGGHRLRSRARVGLKLGGWLLQPFNQNDPTVGESVSNVTGVVDVFPLGANPVFARGGLGWGSYTNNHPAAINGSGLAWEGGGGYQFRLSKSLRLAPMAEYSAGRLEHAGDPGPQTDSHYSVFEFKLAVLYQFGK